MNLRKWLGFLMSNRKAKTDAEQRLEELISLLYVDAKKLAVVVVALIFLLPLFLKLVS